MIPCLALLVTLLSAGIAGAHDDGTEHIHPRLQIREDRIVNRLDDAMPLDDLIHVTTSPWCDSWCVVKGTQTYSLDEFVKSGRFCDTIDRHSWVPRYEIEVCSDGDKPCWDFQRCAICERVRKKRVAYTEINEWAE